MHQEFVSTVLNEMLRRLPNAPRLIVGVDGLSAAGKTSSVQSLQHQLIEAGVAFTILHLDDHIVDRSRRYNTGQEEWYEYYALQWDVEALTHSLFQKLRAANDHLLLDFYDGETDTVSQRRVELPHEGVILLEGVFLQRPEWRGYFDYMIYVDMPRSIRFERDTLRSNQDPHNPERLQKFQNRYWKAEDHYLETVNPVQLADLVLENK